MDLHTARAMLNDVAPHDLSTLAWEALDVVLLELDRRHARIEELEAIEDRAQRVVAHIPDSDWVKCARVILDGKSGPLANS